MYYVVEDKNGKNIYETKYITEAKKRYNTKRASLIQIYMSSSKKVTNGVLQPNLKSRLTVRGKVFIRPYIGFFSKKEAEKIAKGFKNCTCIIRKYKQGYQVFVNFK